MRTISCCPDSSNRHSSTLEPTSEKIEKFVPLPSQVAPSGNGSPSQISRDIAATYAMQKQIAAAACGVVLVAVAWTAVPRGADAPVWNPRAAAGYLDQRAGQILREPGTLKGCPYVIRTVNIVVGPPFRAKTRHQSK